MLLVRSTAAPITIVGPRRALARRRRRSDRLATATAASASTATNELQSSCGLLERGWKTLRLLGTPVQRGSVSVAHADRDCEWTTFPASFEEELAAYRAAGRRRDRDPRVQARRRRGRAREAPRSRLSASACLPAAGSILPSPLIPGPDEPEARVESICARWRASPRSRRPGLLPDRAGRGRATDVVEGIRRIAEAGRGTACASRSSRSTSPRRRALVRADDRPGARADRQRRGRDPVRHLALRRSPTSTDLGVHVADHRDRPGRTSTGCCPARVAGRGARPRGGGYGGWLDVELMSDDGTFENAFEDSLWTLPPRSSRAARSRAWRRWPDAYDAVAIGSGSTRSSQPRCWRGGAEAMRARAEPPARRGDPHREDHRAGFLHDATPLASAVSGSAAYAELKGQLDARALAHRPPSCRPRPCSRTAVACS